jgi:flagellar hook-basal body complex protein FliE
MPGPISSISFPALETIRPSPGTRGSGFQDVLVGAIREVENAGQAASTTVERFLTGEGEELHTAALATQRAELTFELFLQARNKVVQAYQEIMRMPM